MKSISEIKMLDQAKTDMETISYEDFELESANAGEGTMNLKDGVDCPICKNKGKTFYRRDGYMIMRDCKCMAKRKSIRYIRDSELGDLLKHRINDYNATEDWQKQIKQKAVNYITSKSSNWFVLLGQPGSGKTTLCSAIAKKLLDDGIETIYSVWGVLAKEIKMWTTDEEADKMFYRYTRVPVLYIDDFFKGKYTETDVSNAFQLINHRYNNNLVTIISSERLFDGLMEIDAGIASRIKQKAGPYMIQISYDDAKNYRLKNKEAL